MRHFENIFFCEYSQTYRSYPQNYWLASVEASKLIFDSWDGAIKKFSFKKDVIKLHHQIKEAKEEYRHLKQHKNLIPVIIKSNFEGVGVQFWTERQIKNRVCRNTDLSDSYFISKL